MAQQMTCDGCGQLPGILLVTNIEKGDILALCPPCSGIWAEAHWAAMAEAFPEQVNAHPDDTEGAESTSNIDQNDNPDGGGEHGSVRGHDRGPGRGDRPAAAGSGSGDSGADHRGGGSEGAGAGLGGGDGDGRPAGQPDPDLSPVE